MDKVKKYIWTIGSHNEEQLIKYEQGSFYIGDVDIDYIKASKYPTDFNLTQEDIDKLDRGEKLTVEKTQIKKFIISKVDE